MKNLILTGLFLIGASASAEVLKGKALEAQIVKMGYCVGVKDSEGSEYSFEKNGTLTVRTVTSEEDDGSYGNDYENSYGSSSEEGNGYEGSYDGPYSSDPENHGEVRGKWSVNGSRVIVKVAKSSYDLVIGFKSKTCWAN